MNHSLYTIVAHLKIGIGTIAIDFYPQSGKWYFYTKILEDKFSVI